MARQTLPVEVEPVLPGTIPVLRWFAEERLSTARPTGRRRWLHCRLAGRGEMGRRALPVIAQELGTATC